MTIDNKPKNEGKKTTCRVAVASDGGMEAELLWRAAAPRLEEGDDARSRGEDSGAGARATSGGGR
jgi:hypothetical protein